MASSSIVSTQIIVTKPAESLQGMGITFFNLPGELRNEIYSMVLGPTREHVPRPSGYTKDWDRSITLLQASSQVFHEARSLMANYTMLYVLVVLAGESLPFSIGNDCSSGVENTVSKGLQEFMNVHFHLHLDIIAQSHFEPTKAL